MPLIRLIAIITLLASFANSRASDTQLVSMPTIEAAQYDTKTLEALQMATPEELKELHDCMEASEDNCLNQTLGDIYN